VALKVSPRFALTLGIRATIGVQTDNRYTVNIDPLWLFLSLIPSGAGFVLFVYGKKQARWPQLAAGLALMIYPYFATSLVALVAWGALISVALWSTLRLGW